jgi:hypothetical protein
VIARVLPGALKWTFQRRRIGDDESVSNGACARDLVARVFVRDLLPL